jgi:hypothetical protein
VLALIVLAYFVFIHLLEGYIVTHRVLARAGGLHLAVSAHRVVCRRPLVWRLGRIILCPDGWPVAGARRGPVGGVAAGTYDAVPQGVRAGRHAGDDGRGSGASRHDQACGTRLWEPQAKYCAD